MALPEGALTRAAQVARLADYDAEMEEHFLNETPALDVPAPLIHKAVRAAVRADPTRVAPVVAGASLRNKGVQPLLDAIVRYLPDPTGADAGASLRASALPRTHRTRRGEAR